MEKNVGKLDRIIRVVLGIILLCLGLYLKNWLLDLLGLISLATAAIGWCGLYKVFGISTCKVK
jgi:hypothetical protein